MELTSAGQLSLYYGSFTVSTGSVTISSGNLKITAGSLSFATTSSTNIDLRNDGRFTIGTVTGGIMQFTSNISHKFYAGSTLMCTIDQSGIVITGNTAQKAVAGAWTGASDIRLKKDVETANIDTCYENVKKLRLVRHGWVDGFDSGVDGNIMGWIAQEVLEVLPKSVGEIEINNMGKFLSLDPTQIYNTMYGAVQRLMQKVEALEEEVSVLRDLVQSR
jgi:hypothetical protein